MPFITRTKKNIWIIHRVILVLLSTRQLNTHTFFFKLHLSTINYSSDSGSPSPLPDNCSPRPSIFLPTITSPLSIWNILNNSGRFPNYKFMSLSPGLFLIRLGPIFLSKLKKVVYLMSAIQLAPLNWVVQERLYTNVYYKIELTTSGFGGPSPSAPPSSPISPLFYIYLN